MKNLALFASLAVVSLGFSSCCSMFGLASQNSHTITETRQVKTCKTDTITETIVTGSGKGGMVQVVEKKVPRYKTVTKKVRVRGSACVRPYCPTTDACGTTSEKTLKLSTGQPGSGSPFIGLAPTMKPLAP